MRLLPSLLTFLALSLLAACGPGVTSDGGTGLDAGTPDANLTPDAGAPLDAETAIDAGAPLDADAALDAGTSIGAFTGMCGVLDTELTSSTPHYIDATATFPDGWTIAIADSLSAGAQEILRDGTAGGSSSYSEAFAFEVLHRCEGATLIKTETEILYSAPGSITDILVEIDGLRIGVSVTRAVTVTGACMRADTYADPDAMDLLARKLAGVNESSMLVTPADMWTKQILFVFADTATHADALMRAWSALDATLRADTILLVAVSEGMDSFIYFEDRC